MFLANGFYDLNISDQCIANGDYEKTIKKLYDFGYRTIAINQVVEETSLEPKKKKKKGEPREIDVIPSPIELKPVEGCEDMKLLNRLTLVYSNKDLLYKMIKSPFYKKYHIIAVLPTSPAALQFACSNLDADILTFDPMNKTQYRCSRKIYNQLISRGYHFEIMYGPAIHDYNHRRNIINISHIYHTFGKSKNIIFSSGATKHYFIRGPYDVINLGLIFGLGQQQSKSAVTTCPKNTVINSVGRRCGKVVMIVENIDPEPVEETTMEVEAGENEDEDMELTQPAQKKIKS